jgi:hypothetical protein
MIVNPHLKSRAKRPPACRKRPPDAAAPSLKPRRGSPTSVPQNSPRARACPYPPTREPLFGPRNWHRSSTLFYPNHHARARNHTQTPFHLHTTHRPHPLSPPCSRSQRSRARECDHRKRCATCPDLARMPSGARKPGGRCEKLSGERKELPLFDPFSFARAACPCMQERQSTSRAGVPLAALGRAAPAWAVAGPCRGLNGARGRVGESDERRKRNTNISCVSLLSLRAPAPSKPPAAPFTCARRPPTHVADRCQRVGRRAPPSCQGGAQVFSLTPSLPALHHNAQNDPINNTEPFTPHRSSRSHLRNATPSTSSRVRSRAAVL